MPSKRIVKKIEKYRRVTKEKKKLLKMFFKKNWLVKIGI